MLWAALCPKYVFIYHYVHLSSSSLAQMVEKIERRWAFLDNNLSGRHQCSRSALWGSLWSRGAVLSQLRLVSHLSLNSLTAKLHRTRSWQASSARSVHWSASSISTIADRTQNSNAHLNEAILTWLWMWTGRQNRIIIIFTPGCLNRLFKTKGPHSFVSVSPVWEY